MFCSIVLGWVGWSGEGKLDFREWVNSMGDLCGWGK